MAFPASRSRVRLIKPSNKVFIILLVASAVAGFAITNSWAGEPATGASGPDGLAFDQEGNLFLADSGNGSIFKFAPDGAQSTFASGLKAPTSLTFDTKGSLFASDPGSHAILKFTRDGTQSTFASGLGTPGDLAFNAEGNLFVSDRENHSIFKFTPSGTKTTFASGLDDSVGLAFDGAGSLFVVAVNSGSVLKFTPAGIKSAFAPAVNLSTPYGLTFDRAGDLFVAGFDGAVFKFAPNGTKTTFASDLGVPNGLAFDRAGNLFVSDRKSHSILKVATDGMHSTFGYGDSRIALSPDKKWEYHEPDEDSGPRIVKAGTKEMAGDLSDVCGIGSCGGATVIWAPDSKRFAFNWGQGRTHQAALYQMRDGEWKALKTPGDSDRIYTLADETVKAQVKKSGVAKKMKNLHLLEWTVKTHRWVDANTAVVFATMRSRAEGGGGEDREDLDYFGSAFLFTLKFDDAGNWKIVKTHAMSDKEVEDFNRDD